MISYISPKTAEALRVEGAQLVDRSGKVYPIKNGIPRFVTKDNYAAAFGLQWLEFAKTQLDSYIGLPISEARLERCLGEPLPNLKGKNVLEAGSGAGRFTEVLLKHGALVHTFDYSEAVEANKTNNDLPPNPNLQICQADIREIPYPDDDFDYVICLGVIQHTPNPEETIKALYSKVKPGGKLVLDHYKLHKGLYISLYLIYWQIIKRLNPQTQIKVTDTLTKVFFPIHWQFRDSRFIQMILRRISPMAFHYPIYRLSKDLHFQWSRLDTHDRSSDFYKHHRTRRQIEKHLQSLGANAINVVIDGNGIEARCCKPE